MNIGDLIYRRRRELGLTLEEVGNAVGVGKSTVKKWESGFIANMRRDKIAALATVLRISPVELISFEDSNDNQIIFDSPLAPVPPALTEREEQLLDNFRELNDEGQLAAISVLTGLTAQPLYKKYNPLSTLDEKQA